MAYTKPSTLVYQELLNASVSTSTAADLPACIIGPANNVVSIDLTNTVSRARSLAATINTINTTDTLGAPADWSISVNSNSAYAGQSIDATSVSVTLQNALVSTYNEASVAFTADGAGTISTNTIGISSGNSPTSVLPWDSTVNHINVGDIAVIDAENTPVISFVTAVTDSLVTVAATGLTPGSYSLTTYRKFSSSVATVDWDETEQAISLGSVSGETFPSFETPTTAATNDGYRYAVEREIRGYGDSIAVFIGYSATRSDIDGRVLVINDTANLTNVLGTAHPIDNPLAYGVSLALANSGGRPVSAIAIDQSLSELAGYTRATELAEGQTLYSLVPLTTNPAVQAVVRSHVMAMSLPTNSRWRIGLFNQVIPTDMFVLGRPDGGDANNDGFQDNLVEATASGAALVLAEGTVGTTNAGDMVTVFDADGSAEYTVENASGNIITTTTAITQTGQVFIYVSRTASINEQSQAIASQSATWRSNRVLNFPGTVRVTVGTTSTNVPGYYLLCGVAGQISGFPAQTGLTNVTVAGISGLNHANFYFTETQLNHMAEFGTFLYAQNSQASTPFCRHGLTTDVSVLEFREILKVKNWDFLSYYFKRLLDPYIGTWNITPDTIQTIRQVIIAGSEALLASRLPRVGPPLLDYSIVRLEQNTTSPDAIDIELQTSTVNPNNYTNLYLQI